MSFTQATQPEVANYITDIFGADSDDEAEASNAPPLKPQTSNFQGDDDDAELGVSVLENLDPFVVRKYDVRRISFGSCRKCGPC